MARMKLIYIVACTTVLALLLQILTVYNKSSYLSRPVLSVAASSRTSHSFPDRNITQSTPRGPSDYVAAMVTSRRVVKRTKRRLAIGIPTIKRRDGDYFMDMLTSMLNKTSEEQLKDVVFVIFLADLNNTDWKIDTEIKLRNKFKNHLKTGSVEIIKAPASFYRTLPNFGNDSYMNWRTKQNYDYAYLMQYSAEISELYMQMEDDVIATDGYYDAIMGYVNEQKGTRWICVEFSELGFIGKLYHSEDLRGLATMLLIFNSTQPVDYTYLYYNILMGDGLRKIRKPTLFQHMGVHSSLAEKVQPLRDKFFDFPDKIWNGDNPPASIYTTLIENQDFATNLPYLRSPGHFWSYGPGRENDTYLLVFDSPQLLSKIIVETGSKERQSDIVKNGVVEASATISGSTETPSCNDFIILGHFVEGKILVNETEIRSQLGRVKTKCLQIRLTRSQNEWVILKEIAVFVSRT